MKKVVDGEQGGISKAVNWQGGGGFRFYRLGEHDETGYYLLYNGILGDKRLGGGNVLTRQLLAALQPFGGPKIIYGEMSRLPAERLRKERITFKQIPYDVKAR